jgi:hypothetical protein
MLSRLMDLVVLVAELTQNNDKSYKDLDKELMMRGYSQDEIERAVVWYTTRDDVLEEDEIVQHGKNSFRVLSDCFACSTWGLWTGGNSRASSPGPFRWAPKRSS